MGKFRPENGTKCKRRFGQPCGKNSRRVRQKSKALALRREERLRIYHSISDTKPYQIINRRQRHAQSSISTKFILRRMPVLKVKNSKLLRVSGTSLKFTMTDIDKPVTGYRIVNLEMLQEHLLSITSHTCLCSEACKLVAKGDPAVTLKSEKCKNGLFSVLLVVCNGCHREFPLPTSFKQSNGLYDINVRAVWGSMASGGGASTLNETLSTMDIPPMRDGTFSVLEGKIGSWWGDALKEELVKAGLEEKRQAIERGDFHDGIPCVTVICDGGWSKRSHKHTYNAFGGVGVVFGAVTKKLLYIGVRNKECCICTRALNKGIQPESHTCFKNWSDSSQSMESDIILEAFLQAESMHGLRYTRIIADGDSSVYAKLQENVPVWGKHIKKLECANHTCKCLRSNLEKLVAEKPQLKGKGKLTKLNRIRLTTAVRCAIRMRSNENDHKQLKKDIINSIYHILGFHEYCSNFCKKKESKEVEDVDHDVDIEEDFSFDDIFDKQFEFWRLPSEKEMEECRRPAKNQCSKEELREVVRDVQVLLNRIAEKSERLIGNFTTNLCESWMSIRSKFDGGKFVNRCGRGSWNARCYGGALRKNVGIAWSPLTFHKVTGMKAGQNFMQGVRRRSQKLQSSVRYNRKPESKTIRRKRKLKELKTSQSKRAKLDYGSNLDDSPDISTEKLHQLCSSFLEKNVSKSKTDIDSIEIRTVDQSTSELWNKERHIRLTSSNFGKVVSRKPSNVSPCLVKSLLYNKFKGNINTIRGIAQEEITVIEYKNLKTEVVEVKKTGIRICESHPFLAASTDGIVHTKTNGIGLLEIKNFLQNNLLLIADAVKKVPSFCLELSNDKLQLKKKHAIYFQIQGQLNIFDKEWCDFVLRRTNPHDIYIERIWRDKLLWENVMVPKLQAFYDIFLLPELAAPRYGTYTGIRHPKLTWFEGSKTCGLKSKKGKKVANQSKEHDKQPTCSASTSLFESSKTCGQKSKKGTQIANQSRKDDKLSTCTASTSLFESSKTCGEKSTKVKTVANQCRKDHKTLPICSASTSLVTGERQGASRRRRTVKFVGREILHKRTVHDKKKTKWYRGNVLDVVSGRDGDPNAVHEVLYEGEDMPQQIPELQKYFNDGSLKFTDI